MPTGYIVISVLLPVIALFVGIGLAYAWHRTQAKRRQRDIEVRLHVAFWQSVHVSWGMLRIT